MRSSSKFCCAQLVTLLHYGAYLSAAISGHVAKFDKHLCAWLDFAGSPTLNCPTVDLERLGHVFNPVARRPERASDFAETRSDGGAGRRRLMVGPIWHRNLLSVSQRCRCSLGSREAARVAVEAH